MLFTFREIFYFGVEVLLPLYQGECMALIMGAEVLHLQANSVTEIS